MKNNNEKINLRIFIGNDEYIFSDVSIVNKEGEKGVEYNYDFMSDFINVLKKKAEKSARGISDMEIKLDFDSILNGIYFDEFDELVDPFSAGGHSVPFLVRFYVSNEKWYLGDDGVPQMDDYSGWCEWGYDLKSFSIDYCVERLADDEDMGN